MRCLFVLVLLLLSTRAALWREENIREMQTVKQCLSPQQANLITTLFPGNSPEYEKREAMALDTLARLIKNGSPFCRAYSLMVQSATQHLDSRVRVQQALWQESRDQFVARGVQLRGECGFTAAEDSGPLSRMNHCIARVLQHSVKALIKAQYAPK